MRKNVRRITDGAIMAAIMGLLIAIDGQSGMILDGLLFWFLPIPIIVYTVKYDLSSGIMVSVAISILAFIITLPHIAILVAFSNIIGLAYAFAVNKGFESKYILLITFIATFLYYFLSMQIFAGFFGYDAVAELKAITDFFNSFGKTLNGQDFDAITFITTVNPFMKMLLTFPLFLPATISVLQTIITNMMSSVILKRLDLAEIRVTPVLSLRLNKKLGFGVLAILILTYVYNFSVSSSFDNVIILVQFMMQLVFIVMGSILCMTYVALKKMPLLSILIALLIIVFPLLIMLLGIVDVFTDKRIQIIRRFVDER